MPSFFFSSFHIGSLSKTPSAFEEALEMAAEVFEFNQKQLGYNFSLLDIGGGFPGTRDSGELFEKMAATITSSLSRHFSAYPGVRIIAEPGNDCISFAYTNTLNCKCYLACTEVYTPYPPLYYSKYAGMLLCNVASFPYTHDNFLFSMVV